MRSLTKIRMEFNDGTVREFDLNVDDVLWVTYENERGDWSIAGTESVSEQLLLDCAHDLIDAMETNSFYLESKENNTSVVH